MGRSRSQDFIVSEPNYSTHRLHRYHHVILAYGILFSDRIIIPQISCDIPEDNHPVVRVLEKPFHDRQLVQEGLHAGFWFELLLGFLDLVHHHLHVKVVDSCIKIDYGRPKDVWHGC